MHKALTVINLPVTEEREVWKDIKALVPTGDSIRKEPGDKISKQEFKDAGMTDEEISEMEAAGSISSDMDAPLHPEHLPVTPDGKRVVTETDEHGTATATSEPMSCTGDSVSDKVEEDDHAQE